MRYPAALCHYERLALATLAAPYFMFTSLRYLSTGLDCKTKAVFDEMLTYASS